MKTLLAMACFFAAVSMSSAQDVGEILKLVDGLDDQFGKDLDLNALGDEIIIISVPTTDQPFRVYDKLKGVKFKPSVQIVGGFGNSGGHGTGMPKGHLREGFVKKYGTEYQSILLDSNSDVAKALNLKGHAIITISIKKKKIVRKKDFGNKIDDFMKAVEEYQSK